jgi:hypothetical protein
MKQIASIAIAAVLACFVSGCIKERLYNTDHPEHGKITLTTDWTERGAGVDISERYNVKIGEWEGTLSGTTNAINSLFAPAPCTIYVWNDADHISLSSQQPPVATADYAAGEVGWLFTGKEDAVIERDKDHAVTVSMHQQVRRLTLELELTGNAAGHIAAIGASLSGVAGAISIENGNPTGEPVTVAPAFAKTGDKYTATIRLLGIAGNAQTLTMQLFAQNDATAAFTVTSDLASQLAAFNADKKTPLTLRSSVEVTLTETGFTASVDNWTDGNGGTVIAD